MNREEFISYLKEPAKLDKKSLAEINELVEEFPFFQTGHMLFLKNLHNLDHIRFGSQLKKSSSIVGNRELLYDLLFPEIGMKPVSESKDEPEPVTKSKIPEKADTISSESDTDKEIKPGNLKSVKTKPSESNEAEQDEPIAQDDLKKQVEQRLAEIRGEKTGEVKKNIPAENDADDTGKARKGDAATEINEEYSDNAKDESDKPEEDVNAEGDLLLLGEEIEVVEPEGERAELPGNTLNSLLTKEETLLDLDYPATIDNSIVAEANPQIQEEPGPDSPLKTGENDIEPDTAKAENHEIHSFESWLGLFAGEEQGNDEQMPPGKLNDPVSNQRNIIDKFIRENPRIQPVHEDHEEKKDMSADSVIDKGELFTETLANIYIRQGYFSKAIFFYQELSLKFPEKSAYFARRIKEIEKRISKL